MSGYLRAVRAVVVVAAIVFVSTAALPQEPVEPRIYLRTGDVDAARSDGARQLFALARANGTVRVTVTLKNVIKSEAGMRSDEAARQRATLRLSQQELAARIYRSRRGIDSAEAFDTVPLLIMTVNAAELERLLRDRSVVALELDRRMTLTPRLKEMREITRIESVWPASLANKGQGALIAVIDASLDSDIVELTGRVVSEDCVATNAHCYDPKTGKFETTRSSGRYAAWACKASPDKPHNWEHECSRASHGSRVTVIAAGSGEGAGDLAGFGPKLDVAFVRSPSGGSTLGSFARAIEIAMAERNSRRPKVITTSLGFVGERSDKICPGVSPAIDDVLKAARALGIPVINSAGNDGESKIDYPGCHPLVLAVGASKEQDDTLAKFSDSNDLVDFLAPGNRVVDRAGVKAELGTSFSTPSVAASIALLANAFPTKSTDDIVTALRCSGTWVKSNRGPQSTPRIDVEAAYKFLSAKRTPVIKHEFENAGDIKPWSFGNGSWSVAGGKLVHDGQAQNFLFSSATTDQCFDDFYAEVSSRKVQTLKRTGFGPHFRFAYLFLPTTASVAQSETDRTPWSGYFIQFEVDERQTNGAVRIYKITDYVFDPAHKVPTESLGLPLCSSAAQINSKIFNRLGALKKGKTLTAYFNGIKLCSVELDADRSGVTGRIRAIGTLNRADLVSGNTKTEIDEVEYLRIEQR